MQISFFEEFPTSDNLSKIKYVSFPTKLYLGAYSLKEFKALQIKAKQVREKIYWPLLQKKEGYWFSPFSQRKAILRTMHDLKGAKAAVMIDAELPTHPQPQLYLTQLHNFFRNRKVIRNFVLNRKNVYTAEYFPASRIAEKLFRFLGLAFPPSKHYPIKMLYSSMHDFGETIIRKEVEAAQKTYGKRLRLALGTMGVGAIGNEPMIDPKLLERDLSIAQDLGVEEVIIFRLGGLNRAYAKILKKFAEPISWK